MPAIIAVKTNIISSLFFLSHSTILTRAVAEVGAHALPLSQCPRARQTPSSPGRQACSRQGSLCQWYGRWQEDSPASLRGTCPTLALGWSPDPLEKTRNQFSTTVHVCWLSLEPLPLPLWHSWKQLLGVRDSLQSSMLPHCLQHGRISLLHYNLWVRHAMLVALGYTCHSFVPRPPHPALQTIKAGCGGLGMKINQPPVFCNDWILLFCPMIISDYFPLP